MDPRVREGAGLRHRRDRRYARLVELNCSKRWYARDPPTTHIHNPQPTALVGLVAACCKKPTRGSKTNTTATVSPVSPSTPSPETPASSLPPTPVPTTLGAGSEKDAPSGTPVHPDDPRRRGKGKLAGGLFLALGLLGVVMAVGLGSTDLFRPKRVVRYAYHLWDLMAWMRIHERAPASAANATALATGDEGLSRLLRDAVYQFAADGTRCGTGVWGSWCVNARFRPGSCR